MSEKSICSVFWFLFLEWCRNWGIEFRTQIQYVSVAMTWLTVTTAVIAAGCRLWNTYWVQALYWGMIRIFPLIFIVVLKGREYLLHSRDSRGEAYSENLSNLPKTTQGCPSPSLCLGLLYWELFIQRDFVSRRCAFYLSTASQLFPFFF